MDRKGNPVSFRDEKPESLTIYATMSNKSREEELNYTRGSSKPPEFWANFDIPLKWLARAGKRAKDGNQHVHLAVWLSRTQERDDGSSTRPQLAIRLDAVDPYSSGSVGEAAPQKSEPKPVADDFDF